MINQPAVFALSELAQHSEDIAAEVERTGRVQLTRDDGADLILTLAHQHAACSEALAAAAGIFGALLTSHEGGHAMRRVLAATLA